VSRVSIATRTIATYDDRYAARLRADLTGHALANSIRVKPDWYYGYAPRR